MLPENESSEEHVLWPRSTSFRIWIRGINWSFGVIYPTGPFCSVCVLGRLVLSRSDILGTRVVESWLLALGSRRSLDGGLPLYYHSGLA